MDQEARQLFKALLKLHIGLAAHVQAQDALLAYLTEQVVSLGGRRFDLNTHQAEITRLTQDMLKDLLSLDEQLENHLQELLKTLPPGEPLQTPPGTRGS